MRREPRNLRGAFTATGLTHFGGMLLVQRFLHRLRLRPALRRATLQRLRQQLFLAPAVLVRPDGRPTLRLAASYTYQEAFRDTLKRIEKFQSPWKK